MARHAIFVIEGEGRFRDQPYILAIVALYITSTQNSNNIKKERWLYYHSLLSRKRWNEEGGRVCSGGMCLFQQKVRAQPYKTD